MADNASTQLGRHARLLAGAMLAVALLSAAVAFVFDWNWLQGPLERRISAMTGRDFRISGQLDVDLGATIVVRATDLHLANANWSPSAEMARAQLLRIEVPFWPLLRGDRVLRRVDLVRPQVLLERNHAGAANWRFPSRESPRKPGRPWRFGAILVHEGHLRLREVPLDTDLELRVDSAAAADSTSAMHLIAQGSGRYRSHSFKLEGTAVTPAALASRGRQTYRIDVRAHAGATRAHAWGAMPMPVDPAHVGVNLHLAGADLEDLYHLLGLAVPSTPPFDVRCRVERDDEVVNVTGLHGRMGDSDIAGVAALDLSGETPAVRAQLTFSRLDLDDLAGLVGAAPGTAPGESASPGQRALARERAASPHVLPDRDYDLRKLRSMDADVRLRAGRVDAGKFPVESLAARLELHDSVLRIAPLDVAFAGGRITGAVRLDARRDTIQSDADVTLRGIDLEQLWPDMQPANVGRINAEIDLQGHGNSVADMLASADGSVGAAMGRGRFSNLLLELVGLDFAEALRFMLVKDKTVPLRCAYGEFDVSDGVMKARSLVFDTTDTVVFGSGEVDLDREALALELRPEPKDLSPLSLRGPLEIDGTFKDPAFHPKPKPLLARVAAAAALYAIAPPAALLALIETGPGENIECHGNEQRQPGRQDAS